MLSASPLSLGTVYIEEDLGSDLHADRFEVTFQGGAQDTELSRLVINGDQNSPGFSVGDVFFDTSERGLGADHAAGFQIESLQTSDPNATVSARVTDGQSLLVLDFSRFHAGDHLVFSIDVDEVEYLDANQTNLERINDGFDPITSGVEFQGSQLTAYFKAPHYEDAEGAGVFWNRYDPDLNASGLPLPADNFDGQRDRTTGAFINLEQQIRPAAISGYVFADDSNDGVRDPGEAGIAGVPIHVLPLDTVEPQSTVTLLTDANGHYEATQLMPGHYRVIEFEQPAAYMDGLDSAGTVDGTSVGLAAQPGDNIESIFLPGGSRGVEYNFGEIAPASIAGSVHLTDADGNCHRTSSEAQPLAGVTIELLGDRGQLIAQTETDAAGQYEFTGLFPGTYSVVELTPDGLIDAGALPGRVGVEVRGLASGDNRLSDISIGPSDRGISYDFCEHLPARLAGHVYHDQNLSGQRESSDAAIGGVELVLADSSGLEVARTTTAADGSYAFSQLRAGVYRVHEVQPAPWIDGPESVGRVDGQRVGQSSVNDTFDAIILRWGSQGVDYDFGEWLPGSIAGRVHADLNADCVLDAEETTLAQVTIQLLDGRGELVATTLTDRAGEYRFEDLVPGEYRVREVQPRDYFQGGQRPGTGGGDAATRDLITRINVGSGQHLVDYHFCEVPPASLSGYVYQDGPTIKTLDGSLPDRIESLRDGVRTADDTPIEGVVLELRNGLDGTPVHGSAALPGAYSDGPIRTVTDADGFYRFHSLPPGNYAVYEVHPAGFVDGIDTPGTTTGLALNPGALIHTQVIQRMAGIPAFDAIVMIPLQSGQASQENNFSEVRLQGRFVALPPTIPPAIVTPPPVIVMPPAVPWTVTSPDMQPTISVAPTYGSTSGLQMSWHLSIVDGGAPRGLQDVYLTSDRITQPVSFLHQTQWVTMSVDKGCWEFAAFSNGQLRPTRLSVSFGVPSGIPIAGDFNGDGLAELGVYVDGQWFIDVNGNGEWDEADLWAQLGGPQDLPVVGDWDGDGKDDIGIFGPEWPGDPRAIEAEPGLPDPANVRFHTPKNLPPEPAEATDGQRLMKHTSRGEPRADLIDHVFRFGNSQHLPVAGDWNGDGIRTIGVFHEGTWQLDADGDGRLTKRDTRFSFGRAGDLPVTGDFNADGIDEIGVYRNGQWVLDSNGNQQLDAHDQVFRMGAESDLPVVGDWDGDGTDDPGTYRLAE